MSNIVGYSLGCVTPVRYDLTQGEDATGNGIGFSLPSCAPLPVGDEVVTLSTVSQSSTPTLIGFSEFADPSVPPKKYLRKDGSGRIDRYDYSFNPGPNYCQGACSGGSDAQTYEGYDSYNAATGVLTKNSVVRTYQNIYSCPPTNQIAFGPGLPADFGAVGVDPLRPYQEKIYTKTSAVLTGLENCIASPLEGGRIKNVFGSRRMDLSVEDTEDNAVARAIKTPGTEAVALRTARTTGFSFDLTTVEATLHCSNLHPELLYRVNYYLKTVDLTTAGVTLTPYGVDIPTNSASYDLDAVTLSPSPGFSQELVNYSISTR